MKIIRRSKITFFECLLSAGHSPKNFICINIISKICTGSPHYPKVECFYEIFHKLKRRKVKTQFSLFTFFHESKNPLQISFG